MYTPFWSGLKPGLHHQRISAGRNGPGFEAFIWRGSRPGPTLLMNAATHGDEYEGPTVLSEMTRSWRPKNLCGTVITVPVLNETAFFAGRRESPSDGKNLARVFPGKSNGSPTERLAFLFRTRLLRHVDYYVDFHSAGVTFTLIPWVGYCMVDDPVILEKQRCMARCFDRFWCWGTPYLPGRTLSAAYEHRVPGIYMECKGRGDVDPMDLRNLKRAIPRLLRALGLVPGQVRLSPHRVMRESRVPDEGHLQIDHPAPCDGILMSLVKLGAWVRRGERIGEVQPLSGAGSQIVRALRSGRVVLIRRQRSVRKGDALAVIVPDSAAGNLWSAATRRRFSGRRSSVSKRVS